MNLRKKTKIITTIGPATSTLPMMKSLIDSGANAFRLNFSHGDLKTHSLVYKFARQAEKESGNPLAIIQDLCGPKIRIGDFETETVTLKKGTSFSFYTKEFKGDENKVFIGYPNLLKEVSKGERVLIDDGKISLVVKKIDKDCVETEVVGGGTIRGRRGVSFPDSKLSLSCLTEKDKEALIGFKKNKVEYVALSFVRGTKDLLELKDFLNKHKIKAKIISKVETREGVENIDEIIANSDGIMVARGDLAVEIGNENVPLVQKSIIHKCNVAGIPVITATQMLESMVNISTPTRAEVSDVANAILDGTDAIMLSQETAVGNYPIEAVQTMTRVAERVEKDLIHRQMIDVRMNKKGKGISTYDAITRSVTDIADAVCSDFIVAVTETGFTARMIARWRPSQEIIALTTDINVGRELAISFGCKSVLIGRITDVHKVLPTAKKILISNKLVKKGDKIVFSTGMPFGHNSKTNTLIVEEV
jgi:pyruvate kinase